MSSILSSHTTIQKCVHRVKSSDKQQARVMLQKQCTLLDDSTHYFTNATMPVQLVWPKICPSARLLKLLRNKTKRLVV